jgi:serine/threonine protein kinase
VLEPGSTIQAKYRIVRSIGRGGMGEVFEGENIHIRRRVAIKVLNACAALRPDVVDRFEREAQAAGRIGSDHILEVLDLGALAGGERFIVMEYLDGETLGERLQRMGHLTPAELLPILRQALLGLKAAHAAGIIHRDLKPDNVFICREKAGVPDFVKLIDFGISKFQSPDCEMTKTRTGALMGTPYYMSPEQARGTREIDHRIDLYAVGVILYEALSGVKPFDAETFNQLMFEIALSTPKPLSDLVEGLAHPLVSLVGKAMARDPADRFQSADEFLTALDLCMPPTRESVGPGKYRQILPLGEGGMAKVNLVVSSGPAGFNKLLVVKEIKQELADDFEFVKMFLDEARLCGRLNHSNIVHTYDVIESADHPPAIVMEFLEGQALGNILSRSREQRLPLELHLRALSEALAGLHYAHELRDYDGTPLALVHRDVSPQNVFVCHDGRVKLLDFGVAKVRGAIAQTAKGVIKGKLAYMAPEILMGKPIDRRADVFSAGVMLWEALAGRRIDAGHPDAKVAGARVNGADPKLADVAPNAPPNLVAICSRAMALSTVDRYGTALELKEAIDAELPSTATKERLGEFVARSFAAERHKMALAVEDAIRSRHGSTRPSSPVTIEAKSQPPNSGASPTPIHMASTIASRVRSDLRMRPTRGVTLGAALLITLGAVAFAGVHRQAPEQAPEGSTPAAAAPEPAPSSVTAPSVTPEPPKQPPEAAEPEPAVTVGAEPSAKANAPSAKRATPRTAAVKPAPEASSSAQPAPTAKPEPVRSFPSRSPRPARSIDESDPYAQ